MAESPARVRRFWQFRVWVLLGLPLVCAPAFLWLAKRDRLPPAERWERENRWCLHPLGAFWPEPGAWVGGAEELVKLARVNGRPGGPYYGQSWCVPADRMVHYTWHIGIDNGSEILPVPPGGLERLAGLLSRLPPSDPTAGPTTRLLVAFPVRGFWVVRTYRRDAVPAQVKDVFKALGLEVVFPPENPGT